MGSYKDYIKALKVGWVGKEIVYEGHTYKVMDVDYNGMLVINKKAEYTDMTTVERYMCKGKEA